MGAHLNDLAMAGGMGYAAWQVLGQWYRFMSKHATRHEEANAFGWLQAVLEERKKHSGHNGIGAMAQLQGHGHVFELWNKMSVGQKTLLIDDLLDLGLATGQLKQFAPNGKGRRTWKDLTPVEKQQLFALLDKMSFDFVRQARESSTELAGSYLWQVTEPLPFLSDEWQRGAAPAEELAALQPAFMALEKALRGALDAERAVKLQALQAAVVPLNVMESQRRTQVLQVQLGELGLGAAAPASLAAEMQALLAGLQLPPSSEEDLAAKQAVLEGLQADAAKVVEAERAAKTPSIAAAGRRAYVAEVVRAAEAAALWAPAAPLDGGLALAELTLEELKSAAQQAAVPAPPPPAVAAEARLPPPNGNGNGAGGEGDHHHSDSEGDLAAAAEGGEEGGEEGAADAPAASDEPAAVVAPVVEVPAPQPATPEELAARTLAAEAVATLTAAVRRLVPKFGVPADDDRAPVLVSLLKDIGANSASGSHDGTAGSVKELAEILLGWTEERQEAAAAAAAVARQAEREGRTAALQQRRQAKVEEAAAAKQRKAEERAAAKQQKSDERAAAKQERAAARQARVEARAAAAAAALDATVSAASADGADGEAATAATAARVAEDVVEELVARAAGEGDEGAAAAAAPPAAAAAPAEDEEEADEEEDVEEEEAEESEEEEAAEPEEEAEAEGEEPAAAAPFDRAALQEEVRAAARAAEEQASTAASEALDAQLAALSKATDASLLDGLAKQERLAAPATTPAERLVGLERAAATRLSKLSAKQLAVQVGDAFGTLTDAEIVALAPFTGTVVRRLALLAAESTLAADVSAQLAAGPGVTQLLQCVAVHLDNLQREGAELAVEDAAAAEAAAVEARAAAAEARAAAEAKAAADAQAAEAAAAKAAEAEAAAAEAAAAAAAAAAEAPPADGGDEEVPAAAAADAADPPVAAEDAAAAEEPAEAAPSSAEEGVSAPVAATEDKAAEAVEPAAAAVAVPAAPSLARRPRHDLGKVAAAQRSVSELLVDGLVLLELGAQAATKLHQLRGAVERLDPKSDGMGYNTLLMQLRDRVQELGPIGAAVEARLKAVTEESQREQLVVVRDSALSIYRQLTAFLQEELHRRVAFDQKIVQAKQVLGTTKVANKSEVLDGTLGALRGVDARLGELDEHAGSPEAKASVEAFKAQVAAVRVSVLHYASYVRLREHAMGVVAEAGVAAAAGPPPRSRSPDELSEAAGRSALRVDLAALQRDDPAGQLADWTSAGLKLIARGQVAVVLLAGGMEGEDAAARHPRTCLDIGLPSTKCLLQLYAERLLRVQQLAAEARHGKGSAVVSPIHWYIGTSAASHKPTLALLLETQYFGLQPGQVHVFEHDVVPPCVTEDAQKLIMELPWKSARGSTCSGDVFVSLRYSGMLGHMDRAGVRCLDVHSLDDNAPARLADPAFVGCCHSIGLDCAAKVCQPGEGPLAAQLAAYRQLAGQQLGDAAAALVPALGIYYFSYEFVRKIDRALRATPMALYRLTAHDKILTTSANKVVRGSGYRMERRLADFVAVGVVEGQQSGLLVVSAADEFAPVWGAAPFYAPAQPSSALEQLLMQHTRWVQAAGGALADGEEGASQQQQVVLEVSPLLSYAGEGLDAVVAGRSFDDSFDPDLQGFSLAPGRRTNAGLWVLPFAAVYVAAGAMRLLRPR